MKVSQEILRQNLIRKSTNHYNHQILLPIIKTSTVCKINGKKQHSIYISFELKKVLINRKCIEIL